MILPVTWILYRYLVHQPGGFIEMGGFQVGGQWRTAVLFLPSQMLAAFLPVMSSMAGSSPSSLQNVHRRTLIAATGAAVVSGITVIALLPLITSLYGPEFLAFQVTIALMVFEGIMEAVNRVYQNTFMAVDRTWILLFSTGTFSSVALAAGFLIIPTYKAAGLAGSLVIGQTMQVIVQAAMARRVLRRQPPLRLAPARSDLQ